VSGASATLLSGAATQSEVVDAAGRRVAVRTLNALDKLRLFKAVGADLAQNAPYLGMAMLAWSVTMIDGVPAPSPTTEAQVEALVARLGDDGLDAIATVFEAAPERESLRQDAGN
jgi:hypothetical protein